MQLILNMVSIIVLRIMDVSLATTRTILLTKNKAKIAALIGFIEVIIYIKVLGNVVSTLDNYYYLIAYATGFSLGNYLGSKLEKYLAFGDSQIRLIIKAEDCFIIDELRDFGYGVTTFEGNGKTGPKIMILIAAKRKDIPKIEEFIKNKEVDAFLTVNDLAHYSGGTIQNKK